MLILSLLSEFSSQILIIVIIIIVILIFFLYYCYHYSCYGCFYHTHIYIYIYIFTYTLTVVNPIITQFTTTKDVLQHIIPKGLCMIDRVYHKKHLDDHVLQITNGSQLRRFQLGEDEQDLSQRLGHQFGLSENAVYLAVLLRNMVINPTSLGYFPTNPKFDSGIIHFKRCGKYYNCIVSVLL